MIRKDEEVLEMEEGMKREKEERKEEKVGRIV